MHLIIDISNQSAVPVRSKKEFVKKSFFVGKNSHSLPLD